MGAAAYLTVQLDEGTFGGAATQHREVMLKESAMFRKCFPTLEYMAGGVASGMKHVTAMPSPARSLLAARENPRTAYLLHA